jgi:predicted nucleic acid-binding protein
VKFILDASVGAKAAIPELDSDKAIKLLEEYGQGLHELLSPDFYPFEIIHSITRAERQKRITQAEGAASLQDIIRLMPRLEISYLLLSRAYEIASQERIGAYDSTYLALSEREDCELITADDKLIKAMSKKFKIRALSSL